MCSCNRKVQFVPSVPPPQFSVSTSGGGIPVEVGSRSQAIFNVNGRTYKVDGGSKIRIFDKEALALIDKEAPIWIIAS